MPNNPRAADNLTPFKPGQSGNPKGKPKGRLNLSTHIQNLLNDESFEANLLDPKIGIKEYKGIPIAALIHVAIQRGLQDKDKGIQYFEWLAKYGFGTNVEGNAEEITIKYEIVNRVPEPKD